MRAGRGIRGWNQATLADEATAAGGRALTRTTISKIEAGREPKLWEAAGIAASLGFSLDVFLPGYVGPVTYGDLGEVRFPLPSGSADLREAHSGPATPMRSAAKADIAMMFPDPAESGSMEEAVQQRTREEQIERQRKRDEEGPSDG